MPRFVDLQGITATLRCIVLRVIILPGSMRPTCALADADQHVNPGVTQVQSSEGMHQRV